MAYFALAKWPCEPGPFFFWKTKKPTPLGSPGLQVSMFSGLIPSPARLARRRRPYGVSKAEGQEAGGSIRMPQTRGRLGRPTRAMGSRCFFRAMGPFPKWVDTNPRTLMSTGPQIPLEKQVLISQAYEGSGRGRSSRGMRRCEILPWCWCLRCVGVKGKWQASDQKKNTQGVGSILSSDLAH